MRARPQPGFGLILGVIAAVVLLATQLPGTGAVHAQTAEEPLEVVSGDCRDYLAAQVPFSGDRNPPFWNLVWRGAVDNGYACDMLSGVGGVSFSVVDGEAESGPNGIPQFRQGDVVEATTDFPSGTTITWSWVPGAPIEGCGTSETTCRFEVSGVGYRQLGVYQRGACGAIRCLEAAAWKAVYIAGSGTISGRVTNTDGEPVEGILLTVVGGDDTDEEVVTDENGDYEIDVPQGDYVVTPRDYANAYEPGTAQFQQFEPANENVELEDEATADFELRGWELSGVISEDREDTPLPDVRVKVWRGERSFTATTDGAGRYEITLPEGSYTVEPRTPIPHEDAAISGGAVTPRRLAVSLTADIDDADFEVDTTLDLELEIESGSGNRRLITVTVLNQDRDPVPNQEIELEGWTFPPWALVCRDDGRRVWPTELPSHGSGYISFDEDDPIMGITDGDGTVEFYLLAGTQAGTYSMEARIPDSDRESESDVTSTTLSAGVSGLPDGITLADELAIILRTTQTRTGVANQTAAVGQLAFLMSIAERGFNLAPYAPIQAADGSAAGILFYRSSDRDTTDVILDAMLEFDTSVQQTIQGFVLDGNPVGFVGQGSPVPPELPTFRQWFEGYDGQDRVSRNDPDGTPPPRFAVPPRGPTLPGRQGASEAETQLTFWGWPTPPRPSSGEAWSFFSRCTETRWSAAATVTSVYSPVNLLYTDSNGARLGYDDDGEFHGEIFGGFVDGEPGDEPVNYILPVGDYELEVFGTGSGPATIRFETPGEAGPEFTAFTFEADDATDGSLSLVGNVPQGSLIYGEESVPATAGLPLSVDGVPASLPVDAWTEVTVSVSNQLGEPAGGATVRVTAPDGSVDSSALVREDGTATFGVRPLTEGLPVVIEVSGPGWEPVTASIATTAAVPPPEPEAPPAASTPEANATTPAPSNDATASADATTTPAVDGDDDDDGGGFNPFLFVIVAALALAGGGGYLVWRRRAVGNE